MKGEESPLVLAAYKIVIFVKPLIKEIAIITNRKYSENYKFNIDWLSFKRQRVIKKYNILTRTLEAVNNFDNVYDYCESRTFVPSEISI